jgi:hypothetical protein
MLSFIGFMFLVFTLYLDYNKERARTQIEIKTYTVLISMTMLTGVFFITYDFIRTIGA